MAGENLFSDGTRPRHVDEEQVLAREADAVVRLTQGLLEEVLDRTEAEGAKEVDSQSLDALLQVAGRHKGRELCVDPVLIELVEVILMRQFDGCGSERSWQSIAERIARTLFEDPQSHARLARFWSRLLRKAE